MSEIAFSSIFKRSFYKLWKPKMISHKHFTKNVKHHDFLHTYPGVVTVGDGLLDLISSRVAFLLIGRVVGVANTSESLFAAGTCNLEAGVVSILAVAADF